MKITSFNKAVMKALAVDVEKAVRPVADKYGIAVQMHGGTYEAGRGTLRVQFVPTNADGSKKSEFESDFTNYASLVGLKSEHLFAEITHGGTKYKLIGLNIGRHRCPLHAERLVDGKRFFLPRDAAKSLMSEKDGGSFLDKTAA